jgi:hypothetical protein
LRPARSSRGGFAMANLAEAIVRRDVLVGRLFANAIAAFDLFSVYLGDVLGLYRVLAERGPLTSAELADEAGVDERYAREWLEQQAASELLEVAHDGDTRRFWLAAGHDEAPLDVSSLNYIAPMARAVLASIRPVDRVLEAFRSGNGVPYADYGDDLHEAQAAFTRPLFENLPGRSGCRRFPRSMNGSSPIHPRGSLTSLAGRAARASRLRAHTQRSAWTGSTRTAPRSSARASTSLAAGSRTG